MNVNFGLFPPLESAEGRGRQAPARTDEGDGQEEGADRPGARGAVGVAFGRGAAGRGRVALSLPIRESCVTALASSSPMRSKGASGEAPMSDDGYRKDRLGNRKLNPETLMLGYGYDPALSEGAVKPPVFLTSTFVFRSAEEGQRLLRLRRRPPRAAGRQRRPASSIRASTTRTARSSRIASRSTRAPRPARCSPPACRRSRRRILAFARPGDVDPALAAALWRHRDAADQAP